MADSAQDILILEQRIGRDTLRRLVQSGVLLRLYRGFRYEARRLSGRPIREIPLTRIPATGLSSFLSSRPRDCGEDHDFNGESKTLINVGIELVAGSYSPLRNLPRPQPNSLRAAGTASRYPALAERNSIVSAAPPDQCTRAFLNTLAITRKSGDNADKQWDHRLQISANYRATKAWQRRNVMST